MTKPLKFHPCVSGLGMICSIGADCASARSLIRGEAAPPTPLPAFERVQTGISDPVFAVPFPCDDANGTTRTLGLLEHALSEAMRDANLTFDALSSMRTACVVGTTVAVRLNDLKRVYPRLRGNSTFLSRLDPGDDPASALCRKYSWAGPAYTISNACSSGADAISVGVLLLLSGVCDCVVAAGSDALDPVPVAGFHSLGITSSSACRPFDAARSGLNLGEGAAVVVLERPDAVRERGFSPRFSLRGFGMASDAFHMTAPNGEGLARAIEDALRRAELPQEAIAFVNAHGTGTEINDRCESQILFRIFGEVPYLSTKGLTGHALGAAGTLEFVLSLLMLDERRAMASAGFENLPDDIPYPPLRKPLALKEDARFALSTSLAFGGCASALIAERIPTE